jgi:aspartate kinase
MQNMEDLLINDITLDASQARVTISGVPDKPGVAAQVFEEIAAGGIVVDMIVQSIGREELANLSFTVPQKDLAKSLELVSSLGRRLGCAPPTSCPEVAKLTVFGTGMRSHTGVASRLFRSLAAVGINVDMINTSEVRMSVVVEGAQGAKALDVLKTEFADVLV